MGTTTRGEALSEANLVQGKTGSPHLHPHPHTPSGSQGLPAVGHIKDVSQGFTIYTITFLRSPVL